MLDIRVRSAKHERILRDQWTEAQKVGIDFSDVHFDKLLVREEDTLTER
jgi:hypothetical protein